MKGQKLVNKFLDEITAAETTGDLFQIFSRADGIDMSYQAELINWEQYQRLLRLINKITNLIR